MDKPEGITKYYAVRSGLAPGIYESWSSCKAQVHGFKGAAYKSFESKEEAEAYMAEPSEAQEIDESLPFAYTDGSFSKTNQRYGYGGFLKAMGSTYIIQGSGDTPQYLAARNISGEVIGAVRAIRKAVALGIEELNLYHDYIGLRCWATGEWKCNDELSQKYHSFCEGAKPFITIHWIHVKGHTGEEGNELADILAREAVGAKLTKKQAKALEAFRGEASGDMAAM